MKRTTAKTSQPNSLFALVLLSIIGMSVAQAAALPLSIKSAVYNKKSASLIVKTHVKSPSGLMTLIHSKGGVLGQTSDSEHTFTIPLAELGEIPCQVEARVGELKISKAVSGAGAECSKVPTCKILPFAKGTKPEFNKSFTFEAQVAIKDKKAAPLTVEWDFAGGVLGHPYEKLVKPDTGKPILSGKVSQPATFIKDNSRYHVRFAASDALGRRCEASVDVVIGQLPNDLPNIKPLAEAAQQSAPARASGLSGETVVVPFEKRSMQCGHEAELMPATNMVAPPNYNTINAYVYQKGLRPVLLGDDKIDMTYAAASNAADPVGTNSINSTSQSWPIGDANINASVKKGELWERYQRPTDAILADGYISRSLIDAMSNYNEGREGQHAPLADEGAYALNLSPPLSSVNVDHGRYMPGKDAPYADNLPQAFSKFSSQNYWFSAYWLPLTDIDDSGRVNPTTLMRVQAVDKDSQAPLASTDVTVTSGKDFHCRECHALGKIGANPAIKRKNAADNTDPMLMAAASDSIEDQEYAALNNMANLHMFHLGMRMNMDPNRPIAVDIPNTGCVGFGMCHGGGPTGFLPDQNQIPNNYSRTGAGTASVAMHRLHGSLKYNADKSDIQRTEEDGLYVCIGVNKADCSDPSKSLFPVRDAEGKILPMEENCLKCHSGQREQCYRDRMYTAGVTCYQCHGDMLAVGQQYPKKHTHPDGNDYRMHWLEQPDCASCHTGSGNQGKDGKNGFFSAGVKTLAFAEDDPSATPNAVDLTNPDQRRFAVPVSELAVGNADYNSPILRTPLYRLGKDVHGQVACAACHGPAHGVWPNRDPNANDNVTSLELQGHTGSLLDCNVCHKPDSFAKLEDIDEGIKVTDAKVGVLGGPHSLHPINDPYWWKSADNDLENKDHSTSGGWHNNVAKLPGMAGEDQCAACHGNDHKGTRLSKTPVDRVFDFSDVADLKQLKKVGIKPKVTVKAGTPIGCDTCHTVTLSCNDSPNRTCGQASEQSTGSSNQAPSLSPSIVDVAIGADFSQQLNFSDPENDAVTIVTQKNYDGQLMLNSSGMLTIFPWTTPGWAGSFSGQFDPNNPAALLRPPYNYQIPVILSDARGAEAMRTLTIRLNCPDGSVWDGYYNCSPLSIYSVLPSGGIDGGSNWTYQVLAESGTKEPLTYSLLDPVPTGMGIDGQGKITWNTSDVANASENSATVQVQDVDGNQAFMTLNLMVCQAPMHWDSQSAGCVGSVHITSQGPVYSNANQYQYQVAYTEDSNRPVTFSLINAPLGFEVNPQGLITGNPSLITFGDADPLSFTVQVATAPDNWARQDVSVYTCGTSGKVNSTGTGCVPVAIQFTTNNDYYVVYSAGQDYSFQTMVTDSNKLPVSFSLIGALPGMSIDGTGKVSWNTTGYAGQALNYGISASDSSGEWTALKMYLNVCPADTPIYDPTQYTCVSGPIQFTSTPNAGASANKVYQYQVETSNANNVPVSYSLDGAPNGMSIDSNGLVSWDATGAEGLPFEFRITASDSLGGWTQQSVYFNVCNADAPNWDNQQGLCIP